MLLTNRHCCSLVFGVCSGPMVSCIFHSRNPSSSIWASSLLCASPLAVSFFCPLSISLCLPSVSPLSSHPLCVFVVVACDYTQEPAVLFRDPSIVCWQGAHIGYAVAAFIFVVGCYWSGLYYVSTVKVCVFVCNACVMCCAVVGFCLF